MAVTDRDMPEVHRVATHGGTPWIQTVYQTQTLTNQNGRAPEDVFVRQLSASLDELGVDHEIHYNFTPVAVSSQVAHCVSGSSEADWRAPSGGAVDRGAGRVGDPPFSDRPSPPGVRAGHALDDFDVFIDQRAPVIAPDSNILLTAAPGGGCAWTNGNTATAGMGDVTHDPGERVLAGKPLERDPWAGGVHAALHELGHNMGYGHRGGGGLAWNNDVRGYWNRTPTAAAIYSNACGEAMPARLHDNVSYHLYYHDCVGETMDIEPKPPLTDDGDGGNGNGDDEPIRPVIADMLVIIRDPAVEVSGRFSSGGGGITAYEWEFGDGSTATGVNATHTYSASGTYTISLTVRGVSGDIDTTSQQVPVTVPDTGNGGNGGGNGGNGGGNGQNGDDNGQNGQNGDGDGARRRRLAAIAGGLGLGWFFARPGP